MKSIVLLVVVALLAACEGPPGLDGSSLLSYRSCHGQIRQVGPTAAVGLSHDRYVYADGSVMAFCYVYDASATYSNLSMYKSGQFGASDGGCSVFYDVDANTSGFWSFSTTTTAESVVTYRDQSSQQNGYRAIIACTEY